MERGDEVLLWLMDDEYALEPISGRALLDARAAARELLTEDADGTELAITQGAFIAAAGLRKDGKPVFTSGTQALETLTAEEILEIAGYYQVEVSRDGENSVDVEPDGKRVSYEDRAESADVSSYSEFEAAGVLTKWKNMTAEAAENRKATGAEGAEPSAQTRKRTESDTAGNTEVYREILRETEKTGKTSDMRGISDFFQRDCRRYNGAYERY